VESDDRRQLWENDKGRALRVELQSRGSWVAQELLRRVPWRCFLSSYRYNHQLFFHLNNAHTFEENTH
jgi:hypothetical protein